MKTRGWILLLWASLSEAFNIDTEHPLRFNDAPEDFFGYRVYQSEFENRKQIIVGAPLRGNSTGEMYSCTVDLQSCTPLLWPGSESDRFFGMSSAVSSDAGGRLTSCSPYLPHECDGNSYLNGVCYQFNSSLQSVSHFTAAYQECTKREVNLVFLFDGSKSLKSHEFEMNKNFIKDVMKKLSNSSIKFAAVQFASTFRTVFDFNDYQDGSAEHKLMKETHMKELTNTHGAIDYVLENILNNTSSGADLSTQKALVIITDGEPTDYDDLNALNRCEEQNILRYIIGVGNVNLNTLTRLASEPKINNTFYIQDYNGLEGLLDNLQIKIYNIEGSKDAHIKDRQKELSQSGFSVLYHKDSAVVGSVGSNEWCGSLYEVTGSGSGFKETEIKDPSVSKDSYMGYSAVLGMRGGVSLLFSGAPRAEHKGLVTLFTKNESTWTVTRNITGEQIGSYFGASLSLLDVDSDGDSDFLLVGAPLFHQSQPRAEGRLYVYALSEEYFQKTLKESNTGRFAASLASLKDLNGDGLSDVAVGAPLENEGEGVVYIYLGDRTHGINPKYAPQRIPARSVLPGLQQFGVSLSGQMDMSDDNLTDVVIGAKGGIVLLKARPVMSVSAQLSFSPNEISLNDFECPGDKAFNAFNLTSCFTVNERTSSSGSLEKTLNISLNLNVDVMRINRGFFDQTNTSSKTLQKFVLLDSGISCSSFPVFMPKCIADTVSPLKIRMNFSQTEMLSGKSTVFLDIYSRTEERVEVPFQRNCNSNNSCVADLKLNFSLTNGTLVVVNQAHFTVLVSLANPGDDSFNTSIVLHYPEGLSLARFDTVKPSRTRSSCGDRDSGVMNRTTCSINLPVYRSGTTTQFLATFRMTKWDYDWPDRMEMMITANSDNNGNISDTEVRKSVPVQYAVDLVISPVAEDSVTYLNFSLEDRGPKPLSIVYKVQNVGVKGLPVSLKLTLPCPTTHVILTPQNFSMQENSMPCGFIKPQDGHCGKFECGQFDLQKYSVVLFILTADAALQNVKEYESKYSFHEFREDFVLDISAELHYNRSRYNQTLTSLKDDPHKSQIAVKVEFVVPPSLMLIVCTGAGGGVILLIIILILLLKCGFFKRKRPEEFPTEDDNLTAVEDSPLMSTNAKVSENDSAEKENSVKETNPSPEPPNTDE